jgi:uncharacterized protein (TIGR02569 family)
MTMTAAPVAPISAELPQHVRTAFGVGEVEPQPVLWAARRAWHCPATPTRPDLLIRPVVDNATAAWSAGVLDTVQVEGVRLARPVRSSDGRWVVGGWAACHYEPGAVQPHRHLDDGVVPRLHAALATVPRPRILDDRDDRDDRLTGCAAAAWGERRLLLDPAMGGDRYSELAAHRRPVRLASQVVHPELFGSVLFDEDGVPAVVDLTPAWRPPEWAAAVVVVDALAWGGADQGLPQRWSHLPEWPQMLLRAVLYRLALHAQHPEASTSTLAGLERAAWLVEDLL